MDCTRSNPVRVRALAYHQAVPGVLDWRAALFDRVQFPSGRADDHRAAGVRAGGRRRRVRERAGAGDEHQQGEAGEGHTDEEAKARFGFFVDALEFGTPPHGGIALGLDRIVAILAGEQSIREVIAFPKTQKGTCPLTDAPAPVDAKQLRELGIRVVEGSGSA